MYAMLPLDTYSIQFFLITFIYNGKLSVTKLVFLIPQVIDIIYNLLEFWLII